MADFKITEHDALYENGSKKIHYLAAGPAQGPLIILVHGWPGIAWTWIYQIEMFARLGFRVIAPDSPGFGQSTARLNSEDYTLETVSGGMLALLAALGRTNAIWVGLNWGQAIISTVARHHPEAVNALITIRLPYEGLEFGFDRLVQLVDRTQLPADKYPNGQWDYIAFYQEAFDTVVSQYESDIPSLLRILYQPARGPPTPGEIPLGSEVRKSGGIFPAGVPLSAIAAQMPPPLLSEGPVFEKNVQALVKTGIRPGLSYYMQSALNYAYNSSVTTKFEKPTLMVHVTWDAGAQTINTPLMQPMLDACTDLTEVSVPSAGNVYFDRPAEVNAAIVRFILDRVPELWPFHTESNYTRSRK